MLAICAYYAGIVLNTFTTYYAHNHAGIIGSSLMNARTLLSIRSKYCYMHGASSYCVSYL